MRSAASASIFLSTSHSDTTSVGSTCTSRSKSHLPYHPQPISPARRGFSARAAANRYGAAASVPEAAMKSRRFMGEAPGEVGDEAQRTRHESRGEWKTAFGFYPEGVVLQSPGSAGDSLRHPGKRTRMPRNRRHRSPTRTTGNQRPTDHRRAFALRLRSQGGAALTLG